MAIKSKNKEINLKDMALKELEAQLDKSTADLFKLRFRAVTAPVKNTMQVRKIRKQIARINTFINQRRKQG